MGGVLSKNYVFRQNGKMEAALRSRTESAKREATSRLALLFYLLRISVTGRNAKSAKLFAGGEKDEGFFQ